jgi:hypothetical protein
MTNTEAFVLQGVEMNRALKEIDSLKSLLNETIFALEMTQYNIEDPFQSNDVIRQADQFHERFLSIIRENSEV